MPTGTNVALTPNHDRGCTVGGVQLDGELLFFKNRDLGREYHLHRTTVFEAVPEWHVLKGVDLANKELAGVSIGVNRHGVCVANTHVLSSPDVPYDMLCQYLVEGVCEQADVRRVAEDAVCSERFQGGRILVAAPGWTSLVEVLGEQCEVAELGPTFAITNHFSLIPRTEENGVRPPGESSKNRLAVAEKWLPEVRHIGHVKSLLRSHVPEKGGHSVCNHGGGGGTETSHIIRVRGKDISWSYLVGYPCENDYRTFELFCNGAEGE
jgi:hypothetical protein